MPDIFTKAKRSEVMSRVRSRGNRSTELRMISIFRAHGISGWRRNRPVFGRPDFVFPVERVAVFVDGCFWHGCPWHGCPWHGRVPASNVAFWTNDRSEEPLTPSPSPRKAGARGVSGELAA